MRWIKKHIKKTHARGIALSVPRLATQNANDILNGVKLAKLSRPKKIKSELLIVIIMTM
jgi:hypothetical protein